MFVTAWLFVDAATICGGFFSSSAFFTIWLATTDCNSVVFPVPGGPCIA